MFVTQNNDPENVIDKHYALKCPHCGVQSNISAISIPRYDRVVRYQLSHIGIVYRCDSCSAPIFLRFPVMIERQHNRIHISDAFEPVERPKESFEFNYLPEDVRADFQEALTCYSSAAYNGFAAMCRRTVQSISVNLGAQGNDKVLQQLKELKELAQVDEETFDVLKQVIIDGHDGAHPHLPSLTAVRAGILLELTKDVLYQLYVRKGKLKEAAAQRQASIQAKP